MHVYLAGPMRKFPLFNFPLFMRVTRALRLLGWTVFSPAERDLQAGFDPHTSQASVHMSDFMQYDLPEVAKAEAVVVLPKWWVSQGARLEVCAARRMSKLVLDARTLEPVRWRHWWLYGWWCLKDWLRRPQPRLKRSVEELLRYDEALIVAVHQELKDA